MMMMMMMMMMTMMMTMMMMMMMMMMVRASDHTQETTAIDQASDGEDSTRAVPETRH
jgi:hypothetical protein